MVNKSKVTSREVIETSKNVFRWTSDVKRAANPHSVYSSFEKKSPEKNVPELLLGFLYCGAMFTDSLNPAMWGNSDFVFYPTPMFFKSHSLQRRCGQPTYYKFERQISADDW